MCLETTTYGRYQYRRGLAGEAPGSNSENTSNSVDENHAPPFDMEQTCAVGEAERDTEMPL